MCLIRPHALQFQSVGSPDVYHSAAVNEIDKLHAIILPTRKGCIFLHP